MPYRRQRICWSKILPFKLRGMGNLKHSSSVNGLLCRIRRPKNWERWLAVWLTSRKTLLPCTVYVAEFGYCMGHQVSVSSCVVFLLTVSLSLSVSEVSRDFGRKQNAHFHIERVYRRSNMGVSLPIWCKSFDNV